MERKRKGATATETWGGKKENGKVDMKRLEHLILSGTREKRLEGGRGDGVKRKSGYSFH